MRTPKNMGRYDSTMRMRILLTVAFLLAHFRRFFCRSLGMIAVRESYLNGASYDEHQRKNRSREEINKTCAYYDGLTPFYCTYAVLSFSYRHVRMTYLKDIALSLRMKLINKSSLVD